MVSSVGIHIGDTTPKIQWGQLDPIFQEISQQIADCTASFKTCLSAQLVGTMQQDLKNMHETLEKFSQQVQSFQTAHKETIAAANKWPADATEVLRLETGEPCTDYAFYEDEEFFRNGKKEVLAENDDVHVAHLPKYSKFFTLPYFTLKLISKLF